MKTLLAIPALGALALAAPVFAQHSQHGEGQSRLDRMLEGRVAGEPVRCIQARPVRSVTIVEGTAIVYESGRTMYVNYTQTPEHLDDDDFLVTERFSPVNLCASDTVTTRSPENPFTGNALLTEFIPYERLD